MDDDITDVDDLSEKEEEEEERASVEVLSISNGLNRQALMSTAETNRPDRNTMGQ
jgi:hypothetical protein